MTPQIHTSYEVSKRLKEFLSEAAVEPMGNTYWVRHYYAQMVVGEWSEPILVTNGKTIVAKECSPAYRLEDLLSRPFCNAMADKLCPCDAEQVCDKIYSAHKNGGLPAVQSALMEMMNEK